MVFFIYIDENIVTGLSIGANTSSLLNSVSLGPSVLPTSTFTTSSMVNNNTFTHLMANNPSAVSQGGYGGGASAFSNPATSTLNQFSLPPYNAIPTTSFNSNVTFTNPLSSQFNSLNLSGPAAMSIKLKPYEELELGVCCLKLL